MAFTTTTGSGGTSLIGTSGVDTVSLNPGTITGAVFIGAQGDADVVSLQTSSANSFTVDMGSGNDTLVAAGAVSSVLSGNDGNDTITITGALVTSTVSGLNGLDTININAGMNGGLVNGNNDSDTIAFLGALTNQAFVVGGQGGDTLNIGAAGTANTVTLTSGRINGQEGADTIVLSNLTAAMQIGGASINGGNGSDFLNAAAANNGALLSGDLGNDTIVGSAQRDTLFGGNGDDSITGGTGADSMIGGNGSDYFNAGTNYISTASAGATAIAAGQTFAWGQASNTAGVDVIVNASMGAGGSRIDFATTGAVPISAIGVNEATLAAATLYYLSGNYTASTGTFTVAANGVGGDTLIIDSDNNVTLSANTAAVVLLGVNSTTLTAANFV